MMDVQGFGPGSDWPAYVPGAASGNRKKKSTQPSVESVTPSEDSVGIVETVTATCASSGRPAAPIPQEMPPLATGGIVMPSAGADFVSGSGSTAYAGAASTS